jgi:hypothetical protein
VTLRIGRTIFVMLLAAAIVALPAAVNIASAAPTAGGGVAATPDCDHHHNMPSDQTQKAPNHGDCSLGCALCFGFMAPNVSGLAYAVSFNAQLGPVRAAANLSSLTGGTPFRPPRS